MRRDETSQLRFDCTPISQIELNVECRDEIIPLLAGLQHIYGDPKLRARQMCLVAKDVSKDTRADIGREGFSYWQILVIAVVRLGLNLNYDKLQDLCENHRNLRFMLGIGDWNNRTNFGWRRLQETLSLLRPETIKEINAVIVSHGQQLHGSASERVRADSFVMETNIHYPTESSLMWDGIRHVIACSVKLAGMIGASDWRQAACAQRRIKKQVREVARISASKCPKVKASMKGAYGELIERVGSLLARARTLKAQADEDGRGVLSLALSNELQSWIDLTAHVTTTAFRRTQLGEEVANQDKLFSLYETHTQLYQRGKAGEPLQFGRMALIYEDDAGFISHYKLMNRTSNDVDVVVAETREAQRLHNGKIETASFDRGFYSEANEKELSTIVKNVCLPPRHRNAYTARQKDAPITYRQARKSHPGIESAIGALQCGNGLKRCRDRSELGFERYLGLAVLGRNLHVLGKLLISQSDATSNAAKSKRGAA